jgi:hypothetical protein
MLLPLAAVVPLATPSVMLLAAMMTLAVVVVPLGGRGRRPIEEHDGDASYEDENGCPSSTGG